jgi:5-methyltetrahydrofolate--homocysteine methyltransferase
MMTLCNWCLQEIIAEKKLQMRGIIAIYPANSVGDDIEVYADEERGEAVAKFYGLRQQAEKDNDEPYMCLSDFIAPKGSGVADYIGAFANAAFGLEPMIEKYKAEVGQPPLDILGI